MEVNVKLEDFDKFIELINNYNDIVQFLKDVEKQTEHDAKELIRAYIKEIE